MGYAEQLKDLIQKSATYLSDMLPSEWAEANRIMTSEVTSMPGKFSYDRTPYLREVVNQLSPGSSARVISVMKGAQIGFSTGVIESGIGWIISQKPGNILFLTGHAELAEEAMSGKIDQMIDSCGLRPLIRPNVLRKKNQRTGDTNKSKEFPGGSLTAGSANHKLLRQRSVMYGMFDDYEAMKAFDTKSGSTRKMIEQRFAAYFNKMKLYFISTPELEQQSNIMDVYLLGDQRKYHWPCPCCGEYIPLEWNHQVEEGKEAGITWSVDEKGKLISGSVGYTCQKCFGFFTDRNKAELNLLGEWKPTAEPQLPGWISYHLSSLYAPPGMYDWDYYVRAYLDAHRPDGTVKEREMQTFTNLALGLPWKAKGKDVSAKSLLMNSRPYDIGTIPEALSIRDGNGKIIALTMACDLGGTEDDARLDWELVAWSETGTPYSINQGSIGTFVPRENSMKNKEDRERWSYDLKSGRNVWSELRKLATTVYKKDTGGGMRPIITGIDTGFFEKFAFEFIDSVKDFWCVGLKGKDVFKYSILNKDLRLFKPSVSRNKLYIVEVNKVKDMLSEIMMLRWDPSQDDEQPIGFMNFPQPAENKYSYPKYFIHFEAEHRIVDVDNSGIDIKYKWAKKSSNAQNHFWDVRIYNMALRDIIAYEVGKQMKITNATWSDYAKFAVNV